MRFGPKGAIVFWPKGAILLGQKGQNYMAFPIAEETTPANESDIKHLEKPLEKAKLPQGTPVYADKGYDSTANKDVLKRMKLKSRIMHK